MYPSSLSPWVSWFWGMCLLSALRVSSSEFSPRQSDGWIDSAPFPSLLPIPTPLLLCPWDHLLSQGLFLGNPKLRCGDKLGNGESRKRTFRHICKSFLFFHFYLVIWLHWVLVTAGSFTYSMWDLVPWLEAKPRYPALGSQILSHRTTREILQKLCLLNHSWSKIWSQEVIGAYKRILAWRFVCHFQSVSWEDSKPREGSKMVLGQSSAERLRHTSSHHQLLDAPESSRVARGTSWALGGVQKSVQREILVRSGGQAGGLQEQKSQQHSIRCTKNQGKMTVTWAGARKDPLTLSHLLPLLSLNPCAIQSERKRKRKRTTILKWLNHYPHKRWCLKVEERWLSYQNKFVLLLLIKKRKKERNTS